MAAAPSWTTCRSLQIDQASIDKQFSTCGVSGICGKVEGGRGDLGFPSSLAMKVS
jgi:hypothetical protein